MKLCHLSSLLIAVPALVAVILGRWTDFMVIITQTITSIWIHFTGSPIALRIDQTALAVLIARTLSLAITGYITIGLFILGFGYMFIMYTYGYFNKCFCFDPCPKKSDRYHSSIHILGIAIYTASMIWFL